MLGQATKMLTLTPDCKKALECCEPSLRGNGHHAALNGTGEGHMSHGASFRFCDEMVIWHSDM